LAVMLKKLNEKTIKSITLYKSINAALW